MHTFISLTDDIEIKPEFFLEEPDLYGKKMKLQPYTLLAFLPARKHPNKFVSFKLE